MTTIGQILSEAVRIPGSQWGFHPAFPTKLARRSAKAQRASPLPRLMKKGGDFDKDKAGTPEIIPNGVMGDVVIGATRFEWAQKAGVPSLPVKIWLGPTQDVAGHAERFLNELESVRPGTGTTHNLATLAKRQSAALVNEALKSLPSTRSVGVFYSILGTRASGANTPVARERIDLLRKTVQAICKVKPEGGDNLPGDVIAAVSRLVEQGLPIASKWRKEPWSLAVEKARTMRARRGGQGLLTEYLATVLAGRTSKS